MNLCQPFFSAVFWRRWNSQAAIWTDTRVKKVEREEGVEGWTITHRAGSNVARLARLHDVVERPHDLLGRGLAVSPVDLEDVRVGPQALDGCVDGVHDVLPTETALVDLGRDRQLQVEWTRAGT